MATCGTASRERVCRRGHHERSFGSAMGCSHDAACSQGTAGCAWVKLGPMQPVSRLVWLSSGEMEVFVAKRFAGYRALQAAQPMWPAPRQV